MQKKFRFLAINSRIPARRRIRKKKRRKKRIMQIRKKNKIFKMLRVLFLFACLLNANLNSASAEESTAANDTAYFSPDKKTDEVKNKPLLPALPGAAEI